MFLTQYCLDLDEKYGFPAINKTQGQGAALRKKPTHDSASPWKTPFDSTYNDVLTSVKRVESIILWVFSRKNLLIIIY